MGLTNAMNESELDNMVESWGGNIPWWANNPDVPGAPIWSTSIGEDYEKKKQIMALLSGEDYKPNPNYDPLSKQKNFKDAVRTKLPQNPKAAQVPSIGNVIANATANQGVIGPQVFGSQVDYGRLKSPQQKAIAVDPNLKKNAEKMIQAMGGMMKYKGGNGLKTGPVSAPILPKTGLIGPAPKLPAANQPLLASKAPIAGSPGSLLVRSANSKNPQNPQLPRVGMFGLTPRIPVGAQNQIIPRGGAGLVGTPMGPPPSLGGVIPSSSQNTVPTAGLASSPFVQGALPMGAPPNLGGIVPSGAGGQNFNTPSGSPVNSAVQYGGAIKNPTQLNSMGDVFTQGINPQGSNPLQMGPFKNTLLK